MAAHCPPGEVLDMLVAQSGYGVARRLTAPPSDEVAWNLVKRSDVDEVVHLVNVLTSGPLLDRLSKDRRIKVRRAVAANPHLQEETRERLVTEAERNRDEKLMEAVLDGADPATEVELILTRSVSKRIPSWVTRLTMLVLNGEDSRLVQRVAESRHPGANRELLERLLTFMPEWLDPRDLVPVGVAADLGTWKTHLLSQVAEKVLQADPSKEAQEVVLGAFGASVVDRHLLPLAARGEGVCSVVEILGRAVPETLNQLLRTLSSADGVVDDEVAEHLLARRSDAGSHRGLKCTPSARRKLCSHTQSDVAGVHLSEVEDVNEQVELLTDAARAHRGALEHLAFRVSRVQELHDAGLDGAALLAAASSIVAAYKDVPERAQSHLVRTVPPQALGKLKVGSRDLPDLLARDDLSDPVVNDHLVAILTLRDLPIEERHEAVRNLTPTHVTKWLGRAGVREDEVALVLDTHGDKGEHADAVVAAVSTWSDEKWHKEAAKRLALPWQQMRSETVLAALGEVLTEAFGDDLNAWQAALTLYPEWVGSLPELVQAVELL